MAVPIRQLLSQTSYNTDGVTTVWDFSFADGYLDQAHVKVQRKDVVTGVITAIPITVANFIGPYQLSLTPALAAGSELTIYRDTPKDAPIVNFADKAALTETALDTNARQAVMIGAEDADGLATTLADVSDIADEVAAAQGFATAASGSASAAATSATNAAAQVTLATTQATNAAASATAAAGSATAAAASAASIAGGPVASIAGLTGTVTAAALAAAAGSVFPVSTAQAAADDLRWPLSVHPAGWDLCLNGDMLLNQAVQAATTTNGVYFVDGWITNNTATARLTTQQSTAAIFPGFPYSLLSTVTTAGAPAAADYHIHSQGVEGTFMRRLGWGAAGATSLVISMKLRSSVTGTFALSVRNGTSNRSYVTPVALVANTNTDVTIVVPGDTSGTWGTSTGAELTVSIGMAVGSTLSTAVTNAWQAGNFVGITGQTQLTSTNGATFYMTDVRFNPGSIALPGPRLPLDMALIKAKRYYQTSNLYGVAPGTADFTNAARVIATDANNAFMLSTLAVEMRSGVNPFMSLWNAGSGTVNQVRNSASGAAVAISSATVGPRAIYSIGSAAGYVAGQVYDFNWALNSRI